MFWLETNWLPYATRLGCSVLRGDINHIRKQLNKVRKDKQKSVMKEYVKIWLFAMGNSDQNRGRFAANQYLLKLMDSDGG